jgi:hypothetical protein
MDAELLSAFDPQNVLELPAETDDPGAIGSGGIAAHPLRDGASSELPET